MAGAPSGTGLPDHIAASSWAAPAGGQVIDNIARIEAGKPPLYAVDFARGY